MGLRNDSIDTLVDLNRWATDGEDEDNRQRLDELLWAAFLADLRSEFARGRRADERSLNCVVLLDNADSPLGRRFLDQLVHARRQRAVGDQDDPDPLTVVASSRCPLLDAVPRRGPHAGRAGGASPGHVAVVARLPAARPDQGRGRPRDRRPRARAA